MKALIAVVVAAALAILLAVSNPGPEAHKQAIRDAVYKDQPLASALGLGVLSSELATYDSYLFWSTMALDGGRVSVGVLGRVRVDAEKLRLPKPRKADPSSR
jgi:hypothetical protein